MATLTMWPDRPIPNVIRISIAFILVIWLGFIRKMLLNRCARAGKLAKMHCSLRAILFDASYPRLNYPIKSSE